MIASKIRIFAKNKEQINTTIMSEKKPDLVVFNEEKQLYDAAFKPYATSVGAPQIKCLIMAVGKTLKSIKQISTLKLNMKL